MKAYSIFDDFGEEPFSILQSAGIETDVHPLGVPRPEGEQLKKLVQEYDCIILGTGQKITEDMFDSITEPRIIGTASVGLDHIRIPAEKKDLVTVVNTPNANAQSVAEYTIAAALSCIKRISEGTELYAKGLNNKKLSCKPEDLSGKTMGVIGAGNISKKIMQYAEMLGMNVLFWTKHREHHPDLEEQGYRYADLDQVLAAADVISVNLPNNEGTRNLISAERVQLMKKTCVFISISRLETIDLQALTERAQKENNFYVNADIDVNDDIVSLIQNKKNVFITPHIAGGTIETRKRMFREVASGIAALV